MTAVQRPERFGLVTTAKSEAALPLEGEPYAVVLEHGALEVGWYAPRGADLQEPHERDELYVIARGSARFAVGGEGLRDVGTGDVLFVAARCGHRFEEMSDDFRAWVMFYGPEGGESTAPQRH